MRYVFIVLIVWLMLGVKSAETLSCAPLSEADRIALSTFVFEGQVQSITEDRQKTNFSVNRVLKGGIGGYATVNGSLDSWGPDEFEVGKFYRVYADDKMFVQLCAGSRLLNGVYQHDITAQIKLEPHDIPSQVQSEPQSVSYQNGIPMVNLTIPFLLLVAALLAVWEWWSWRKKP